MKTNFLTVLLCAAALCLYGCDNNDSDSSYENTPDDANELEDVCELIPDDYFREYCLSNFDTNNDGKLSQTEADAVTQIVVTSPTSSRLGGLEVDFSGIEHFKNLEYFESNLAVGVVDLSQNTKLTRVLLNDSAVEEVDLRNTNMTTINDYAFYYCSSLISIELPEKLISIGDYAFRYCCPTVIELPETLNSIGVSGFEGCTSLASVTVKAHTPPSLSYKQSWPVFSSSIKSTAMLYVPAISVDLYKESDWKSYFSNIVAIEE